MGTRSIGRPQLCPACGADARHSSANHHPDVVIGLLDLPWNPDIPDGERWRPCRLRFCCALSTRGRGQRQWYLLGISPVKAMKLDHRPRPRTVSMAGGHDQ